MEGQSAEDGAGVHARRDPDALAAARRLLPGPHGSAPLDRLAELAVRLVGADAARVALFTDAVTVVGSSGLSAAEADLEAGTVAAGEPVQVAGPAAYLGVPLRSDAGHVVGVLSVRQAHRAGWSPADVATVEHLGASALAELERAALALEYEASRTRWEMAIDAAAIGSFDWDLVTGELTWDDRLLELFAYERGSFAGSIDAFNARLHPDDLPRVSRALQEAIDTVSTYAATYQIVLPSGEVRWIQARGCALPGTDGTAVRLLGAAFDITDARDSEARVVRVLESMPAGFVSVDRGWRFTYVNAEAERVLGRSRDELLGEVLWERYPATLGEAFVGTFAEAVASGRQATVEAYYPEPLDAWFELRVWPSPEGLSLYFIDVTSRRLALQKAEEVASRASLLAEVTATLSGTLDAAEAAGRLARVVVPLLADWCVVSLVQGEREGPMWRQLRDAGVWHADSTRIAEVVEYANRRVEALDERSFLSRAMTTGERVHLEHGATAAIATFMAPGRALERLVALAPDSVVVEPVRASGRTLGVMTLFRGGGSPPFSATDLEAIAEVSRRAGLALDNARLYARQRAMAESLQRSLLTEPPAVPHGHIEVRYTPAAEAAQVGGDWYDAFVQPDGAAVLVIGDVLGHDTAAAAAMGQVRGLLRGIAATTGDGPAAVLSRLDAAMDLLQVSTTATAIVARLERPSRPGDVGWLLRWSSAGHPPPLLITPAGEVSLLGADGREADLLLGVDAATVRGESSAQLAPGSTVLLYTDGLVERRRGSLDEGLLHLVATAGRLAELPLAGLCDQLLGRMLSDRPDDDVALVAIRLAARS